MKTTDKYGFLMPDGEDLVQVSDLNSNMIKLDGILANMSTSGGGTQSDYTMNNPEDPSYIKNREFYTDTRTINGKILTLNQGMISGAVAEGTVINFTDGLLGLIEGQNYTIDIQSINYEKTLTAKNLSSVGVNYIGLYDAVEQGPQVLIADGCNFQVSGSATNADGYILGAMNEEAKQSVFVENTQIVISGQGMQPVVLETVHKLPAKYLPNTKTEFYREISFSMEVLDPQPTCSIPSGSMAKYFNANLTYWVKSVENSDTDFTLHHTQNCTDAAIGDAIFTLADRDDKLLSDRVGFDFTDGRYWAVGTVPYFDEIELKAPNNIQYLDIDVYRRQPCPIEDAKYTYGAYSLYIGGLLSSPYYGGSGYLTDVIVDENLGVIPSIQYTSNTDLIYKFNSYGLLAGEEYKADTAQHPYRIAQTHDHVHVSIKDNNLVNCEGYATGIMVEPISAALTTNRVASPKYYDRIPMSSSSRVESSDNIKYSNLTARFVTDAAMGGQLVTGSFTPGDKIILRGKYKTE